MSISSVILKTLTEKTNSFVCKQDRGEGVLQSIHFPLLTKPLGSKLQIGQKSGKEKASKVECKGSPFFKCVGSVCVNFPRTGKMVKMSLFFGALL